MNYYEQTISALGRDKRPKNVRKKARPPSTSTVIHQSPEVHSNWNVREVRQALDTHEEGNFFDSAQLIEAMGRDDRISGCMRSRRSALLSRNGPEFSLQPGKGDEQGRFVEEVNGWWKNSFPDRTLGALLDDAVMAGVAIARVPYKTNAKTWTPDQVRHWPLHSVEWDTDKRVYRTTTDAHGEMFLDWDDPNWLILQTSGERSWMGGAVRALGLAYVMRHFNWRDWARFNERHGMPIIAIMEPPEQDEAVRESFWKGVKRMGSTGVVRLPQGEDQSYDVKFLEAEAGGHATFPDFRADLDVAIAVTLLGQNLTTEVSGGSFAATNAHMRVRGDIMDGDAEMLGTETKHQVILPWGILNVPGFEEEDAPEPTWDTGVPEDKAAVASTFLSAAQATEVFRDAGIPVDFVAMFEKLGIPLVEGAKIDLETLKPVPVEERGRTKRGRQQGQPEALADGAVIRMRHADGTTQRFIYADGELLAAPGHTHGVDIDGAEVQSSASDQEGPHTHSVPFEGTDYPTSSDDEGPSHTHSVEINGKGYTTQGPSDSQMDPEAGGRKDPSYLAVASGITAQSDGFISGQVYADALSDHGTRETARILGGPEGLVTKLLAAIDVGTDYGQVRKAVLAAYGDQEPPEELARIIESLWTMAHRAGEVAVDQDV